MQQYRILPGRFQPPHQDHVSLVESVLAESDQVLHVGIVFDSPGAADDPWFSRLNAEAKRQHEPDRCPFTVTERLAMWRDIIDARALPASRLVLLALPRPEAAWQWITSLFPGRRTWIVPHAGEHFDDLKAEFFAAKGDRVDRPKQIPTTDGRIVRSLLDRPELSDHVLPGTAALVASIRKDTR